MIPNRLSRLSHIMQTDGLDACALVPGSNLRYLSGLTFHLMERPILALFARGQPPRLVLPELERAKVEASTFDPELYDYGEGEGAAANAFRRMAEKAGMNAAHIGVESTTMRVLELELLQAVVPRARIASADTALAALRIMKDKTEIQAMQRAAEIAEHALAETLPLIRVGMSERELATEITLQLLRAGSEPEAAFSPIVASGPNSALPHATPSDRRLQAGDILILDWGARHEGYVSDITRTYALGEIEAELARIHSIVQQANAAGREAVRPGATCGEVDAAARAVIDGAGFGAAFLHRTGHGVGLDAHEAPYIRAGDATRLEPGMCFTIEPGIYLAERAGVRVEDDLVVTDDGGRSLTSHRRDLQVIGV